MRTRGMRGAVVALIIAGIGMLGIAAVPETDAASTVTFADAAFQTQWNAGEALTPNFWGPLPNAHVGMSEPWKEAPNTQRTVQYFDKGRMELSTSGVTAGLLATELITGRVQIGTNSFETRPAPAIPIAGDATNPGPTFAAFGGPAAPLLAPATTKVNPSVKDPSGVTTALDANGAPTTFMPGSDYTPASIRTFDDPTKHNVASAFATYRDTVGLTSIGYALSEPFWVNILVGGERKAVLIEVFERRVLTYTPQNPAAFAVEMGNIGAQYYHWRYETTATSATTTPTVTTATASGTPAITATPLNATAGAATGAALTAFPGRLDLPTPTMPAVVGTPLSSAAAAAANGLSFLNPPASVARGSNATTTVAAPAGAYCTIMVTYRSGVSHVDGLTDKTVDSTGKVSWTWLVGPSAASGSAPIDVSCSMNGKTYTVSTTTIVTA